MDGKYMARQELSASARPDSVSDCSTGGPQDHFAVREQSGSTASKSCPPHHCNCDSRQCLTTFLQVLRAAFPGTLLLPDVCAVTALPEVRSRFQVMPSCVRRL